MYSVGITESVVGIGCLVVLLVVGYGFSWLTAAVIQRLGGSPQRRKDVFVYTRIGLSVVGLALAGILYVIYPFLEPISVVLETQLGGLARTVVHGIGLGLVSLLSVFAVRRGTDPAIKRVLQHRHTVAPHHRRRVWISHAILLVGAPVLLLSLYTVGFVGVGSTLVLLLLIFVWMAVRNPVVSFARRTRDPTAGEQSRIDRCFDRFERPTPTVVFFDDAAEKHDIRLTGHGSSRLLWVQESLLSDASDDELTAMFALADRRNDRYVTEQLLGLLLSVLFPITGLGFLLLEVLLPGVGNTGSSSVVAWFGAIAIWFVLFIGVSRTIRRSIYRADDYVATQLDPDVVRHTYDRYPANVSLIEQDETKSDAEQQIAFEPSIEDRIRRLEETHSLEPIEVTVDEDRSDDQSDDSSGRASSWHTPTRQAIGQSLATMDDTAFADVVAQLRRELGRECTVTDASDAGWTDVIARTDDGAEELLRTIHRRSNDPVTPAEITDESGHIDQNRRFDTVIVVTNGRFDDRVEQLERDPTLIDGQRLVEVLEESDLESQLVAPSAE